jgi:site-specific recombinase XerC
VHVATYIEQLSQARSAPTAKLCLAALRHLFDWMVIGQIMPTNPTAAVRGPRHVVRRGKTPVLDPTEARQLIDAIDTSTVIGLRDRALIGLMVYSVARIGAALAMKVEDVYVQNRRLWVRLHEKGGKRHEMPCHHNLETYLRTRDRSEGAHVSDHRPRHGRVDDDAPATGQCLCHDPAARRGGRHRDENRQPYVPRDGNHGLREKRWNA